MALTEVMRRVRLSGSIRVGRPGPLHVQRDTDGWCVCEDDDAPLFAGPSRHEAFVWASEVAQRDRRAVLVHRTDGTVVSVVNFAR